MTGKELLGWMVAPGTVAERASIAGNSCTSTLARLDPPPFTRQFTGGSSGAIAARIQRPHTSRMAPSLCTTPASPPTLAPRRSTAPSRLFKVLASGSVEPVLLSCSPFFLPSLEQSLMARCRHLTNCASGTSSFPGVHTSKLPRKSPFRAQFCASAIDTINYDAVAPHLSTALQPRPRRAAVTVADAGSSKPTSHTSVAFPSPR